MMTRVLAILALVLVPLATLAQEDSAAPPVTTPVTAVAIPQDAQVSTDQAPKDWRSVAEAASRRLQLDSSSTVGLDQLRSDVVTWRDQFAEGLEANKGRISTVQAQLEALGPSAKDGASEVESVANRRAALNSQLAALQAPVLIARENFAEANGLISEIDAVIREKQAEKLAQRSMSPLNPVQWASAFGALSSAFGGLLSDFSGGIVGLFTGEKSIENLPTAVVLFGLGTMILTGRGARLERLRDWRRQRAKRWRGVLKFAFSVGHVVVPLLGLSMIAGGLLASEIFEKRAGVLVAALPYLAIGPLIANWFSEQFFDTSDPGPIVLSDTKKARARRILTALGWLLSLRMLLALPFDFSDPSTEIYQGVLAFPIDAMVALFLYRLGRVLRGAYDVPADQEDDEVPVVVPYRRRIFALAGLAVQMVAVAAVVLGLFGYLAASDWLLYPSMMTLALIAFGLLMQELVYDIYGLILRRTDSAREALIPVLIGFAVMLALMPVVALVWGARVEDLGEAYTRVLQGITIGETQISPSDFVTFAMVFAAGYVITRLIQGSLRNTILPKTRLDKGGQNAVVVGLGYVGIFASAVAAITTAGINLSSLAIVAGALSVGIGFGLQNVVSNFVSGIILLIERPISEGDWIEVGGESGYVRNISVRSTRIETFDRNAVIVPNADLVSGVVKNWTHGSSVGRIIIQVGAAYGSDTRRIEEILLEIAQAHPMVLMRPAPYVLFQGFGASSLDFEIRAILRDVNFSLGVSSELRHQIAERFAQEGIEIPFPQTDVWFRTQTGPSEEPIAATAAPSPLVPDDAASADGEGGDPV